MSAFSFWHSAGRKSPPLFEVSPKSSGYNETLDSLHDDVSLDSLARGQMYLKIQIKAAKISFLGLLLGG